jgi:microsomal dipeptidase-like Zn-dependent dipeptidase
MTTRREFLAQSALRRRRDRHGDTCAVRRGFRGSTYFGLLERARALLDKALLIDTHNDLPSMFLELNGGDVSKFNLASASRRCAPTFLHCGKAGWCPVLVDIRGIRTQKTHVSMHEALREFDAALNIIASQKDFEQARTADDIERIRRGGRIACLAMGVEGGHMIENSPAALRVFHALGARYHAHALGRHRLGGRGHRSPRHSASPISAGSWCAR